MELFYHKLSNPAEWIYFRVVFDGKSYTKLSLLDYCKKLYRISKDEAVIEVYNNHFFYILVLRIIFYKANLRWHYVEYRSGFDYKWYQFYQIINARLVDNLSYLIIDECVAITMELAEKQPFKLTHVVPPLYTRKTNLRVSKIKNSMIFAVGNGYQRQLLWFLRIVEMNPTWRFSLITSMKIHQEHTNLTVYHSLSDDSYEKLLCRHEYGLVVMENNQKDMYRYPNKIGEYVNCGIYPLVTNPNPAVLRDLGSEVVFQDLDCSLLTTNNPVDRSWIYSWETYQEVLQ